MDVKSFPFVSKIGTVNAKITASDFVVALEKGRKKPAMSGRAKNSTETILPLDQYRWLVGQGTVLCPGK